MANSEIDIQRDLLVEKIAQAIDVSGAFDNCFFHAYALYLLANHQELPADLFVIREFDNPSVIALKKLFTSREDLSLFNTYSQWKNPGVKPSNHLVEKTLVLGVMLRSWFVGKLLTVEIAEELFSAQDERPTFLKMVNDLNRDENIRLFYDEQPLYQANKDFFAGALAIKPYDGDEKIKQYWMSVGHRKYCLQLAKPGQKIDGIEMHPVFSKLGISYTVYEKASNRILFQHSEPDNNLKPVFELALNGEFGHYFLLQTAAINELLNEYALELHTYKQQRNIVLEKNDINKVALARKESSMLLAATLPAAMIAGGVSSQLPVLVQRIKELIAMMKAPVQVQHEQENNKERLERVDSNPDICVISPNLTEDELPQIFFNEQEQMNEQEQIFAEHLSLLHKKADKFNQKFGETLELKYLLAAQEADDLYSHLNDTFMAYLETSKAETDYQLFKQNCLDHIDDSNKKGILQCHRGAKEIVGNIVLALIGIGIFYAIAGAINYSRTGRFWFFKTDTASKIKCITDNIDILKPQVLGPPEA